MQHSVSNPPANISIVVPDMRCGGAQRVAAWLANSLADHNCNVTLIKLCGKDTPCAFNLHPCISQRYADIFWPSSGLNRLCDFFRRLRTIRREISTTRPQVLISFLDTANIRVLLSCLGLRVPIIVSERSDPKHSVLLASFAFLRHILYPLAAGIVVQSDLLRRSWPSWWRNVHVIPNPVRPFCPAQAIRFPHRMVLSVSRLAPEKGCDLLLQAYAQIADKTDAHLVFAGDGPAEDSLKGLANSLGLAERVIFLGQVHNVADWLAIADVFALTSHHEGQPNALAEAMAAGLAVVATDTVGALSLIQHKINGMLTPRGDATQLAETLLQLLNNTGLAKRLGSEAARLSEQLSASNILGLWQDLIGKVANKTPPAQKS